MTKLFITQKREAFTLLEVLVAIGIFLMAVGIIYSGYFNTTRTGEIAQIKADLEMRGRLAMQIMSNELRQATRTSTQNPSPNLTIPSSPNNSVHFYLPLDKDGDGYITDSEGETEWDTTNQVKYQFIPGQKILRRLEKGEHTVLANNVKEARFYDHDLKSSLDLNEIEIEFTLSKNTTQNREVEVSFKGRLCLRN